MSTYDRNDRNLEQPGQTLREREWGLRYRAVEVMTVWHDGRVAPRWQPREYKTLAGAEAAVERLIAAGHHAALQTGLVFWLDADEAETEFADLPVVTR